MFTTFATSIIAAFLIETVNKKYKLILSGLIIISSVALTVGYFKPSGIVYKDDNYYLNRFFADRTVGGKTEELSEEYGRYSEDYLLLPKWTSQRPDFKPEQKIEVSDGSITKLSEISPTHWEAETKTDIDAVVTFNSYYFPGWIAEVDGSRKEIQIGKPHGQIQVNVPAGIHEVKFYWSETPLRKVFGVLSVVTLGILIVFLLKDERKISK